MSKSKVEEAKAALAAAQAHHAKVLAEVDRAAIEAAVAAKQAAEEEERHARAALDEVKSRVLRDAGVIAPGGEFTPALIAALERVCGVSYANKRSLLPKNATEYRKDPFDEAIEAITTRVLKKSKEVASAREVVTYTTLASHLAREGLHEARSPVDMAERDVINASWALELALALKEAAAKAERAAAAVEPDRMKAKAARVALEELAAGAPLDLGDGRWV